MNILTKRGPTRAEFRKASYAVLACLESLNIRRGRRILMSRFKWIRITFRCWKDRVPYDESLYSAALRRRGSPLAVTVANSVHPIVELFWFPLKSAAFSLDMNYSGDC